jgi:hypothetical protein
MTQSPSIVETEMESMQGDADRHAASLRLSVAPMMERTENP